MPAKKTAPLPRLRVRRTGRRRSLKTLGQRADVFRELGSKSLLFTSNPTFAAVVTAVGTAHDAAKTADADASVAEQTADAKRTEANTRRLELADAMGLYEHHVEMLATSSDDAQALGVVVLVEKTYTLDAPKGIRVVVDHDNTGAAVVRVRRAPGLENVVIEVSSDGGATFHEVPGTGANRPISGPAVGSHQARAAHQRGTERGPYTAAVVFTIK